MRAKRLSCVVCLLSHGAQVCSETFLYQLTMLLQVGSTDSGGNTSLHLAVVTGSIPMVQVGGLFTPKYHLFLYLLFPGVAGVWRGLEGEER